MLIVKRFLPFGREKLVLPPEKDGTQRISRLKENETMVTFFLVIKTLKGGDYFAVGEPMKDLFIITKEKVRSTAFSFQGNVLKKTITGAGGEVNINRIYYTNLSESSLSSSLFYTLPTPTPPPPGGRLYGNKL